MVDTRDLKSLGLTAVQVRVPSRALFKTKKIASSRSFGDGAFVFSAVSFWLISDEIAY